MMRLEPAEFFDKAIIGTAHRCGHDDILAYDRELIIHLLMEDGMTEEDAIEHFEYNIIGSWVGEGTPIFISKDDSL
jgi:hypothetical protein